MTTPQTTPRNTPQTALYGDVEFIDESTIPKTTLLVVIDTEEEFDWSKPHSRASTDVDAMSDIHKAQAIFDERGVRPCYVVDYPVVSSPNGYEPLREIFRDGRCSIGAHLHPWVTPPFDEPVNAVNSFPGNLPEATERAKLAELVGKVSEVFGASPKCYKAGRYGFGPNTPQIMDGLGLSVDLSPTPGFDYSDIHGPDFGSYDNRPYYFGPNKSQLCLPCTGGLVGVAGAKFGRSVFEWANKPPFMALRAPGILARSGVVERLRLSPEGYTLTELIRLTKNLVGKQGHRVLTLSFHSPTVRPGCTPYVQNKADLDRFLGVIADYLDFFRAEMSGHFATPEEVELSLASGSW